MSASWNRQKIVGIAACALIACAVLLTAWRAPAEAPPPLGGAFGSQVKLIHDRPAIPDFAFKELKPDGKTRDWGFAELRGRVIVVTLWATWCGVCAREMPVLDKLQESLGDEGLLVVALAQDKGPTTDVRAYLKKRSLPNLRVFHDPEGVFAAVLGVNGIPTSFIVDPDGRMVAVAEGRASWDTLEAHAFLRHFKKAPAKTSFE